ncbi:GrpB family protein [Candidatus Bipolaricaulota bacterium]|nr:GrpB family protein [Candidatus Bipolaricaulota bacterium]
MILHEYTPEWETEFTLLREVYLECLGNSAMAIEHVGSTSIPGIKAKPIIDIDIVIKDYCVFLETAGKLASLGYSHNGDQGILHREAFKRMDEFTPHSQPQRRWINHHLYVCPQFSEELNRHIIFRDYLRINGIAKKEYELIKVEIAARSDGDRKRYAAIKEAECKEFIDKIIATAGNCDQLNTPRPLSR